MIHYLLLFQFVFLYCMSATIGLVVYGSNFNVDSGWNSSWLYLFPLIILPALHKWVYPVIARELTSQWQSLFLLMGAVVGLWAYKPMHFAYWDEHSGAQMIAVSLLGIFSYLASICGVMRVSQWHGRHLAASTGALFIIGVIWVCASAFPMVALLGVSLILAVALLWPVERRLAVQQFPTTANVPSIVHPGYLLFLLVLDLSLVVWDYQIDSQWAVHMAWAFIAAALGYYASSARSISNIRVWVYGLVILVFFNFTAGVIWPVWVLKLPHAAIDGLLLGVLCHYFFKSPTGEFQPQGILTLSAIVVWAMVFGYLFYANLDYVQWRVVLLLPYILLLIIPIGRRTDAI